MVKMNNTSNHNGHIGGPKASQYTGDPDLATADINTRLESLLNRPSMPLAPLFTDAVRREEVDDFYLLCQRQRAQYKDYTGRLHALNFFQTSDYLFHCPRGPTSTYLESPDRFVHYRAPPVLSSTKRHGEEIPRLPNRTLHGRYSKESDISFKR